jgi:hypothetical protein
MLSSDGRQRPPELEYVEAETAMRLGPAPLFSKPRAPKELRRFELYLSTVVSFETVEAATMRLRRSY